MLSKRELAMRKSLEERGVTFVTPTYILPFLPISELVVLSGQIHLGEYTKNTVLAYRLGGRIYVPDVEALDERTLNILLKFFE